jgi:hypothetical protein
MGKSVASDASTIITAGLPGVRTTLKRPRLNGTLDVGGGDGSAVPEFRVG